MLNKTALQIQQRDFPNGYIIIIVAAESDDFCQIANENNKCENRTDYLEKRIKITESVNTFSETTLTALFVIIGIYTVIIIFSLSLSIVCFKKFENMKDEVDMKKVSNNDEKGCFSAFVNPKREGKLTKKSQTMSLRIPSMCLTSTRNCTNQIKANLTTKSRPCSWETSC